MDNVHDEMTNDGSACGKIKPVESAPLSRCSSLFGGKSTLQKRFGTKNSVRYSEFRGGHFSKVANVLQVWDL